MFTVINPFPTTTAQHTTHTDVADTLQSNYVTQIFQLPQYIYLISCLYKSKLL